MTGAAQADRTEGPARRSAGISRSDYALLLFLGAIWGSAFPVIRWGLLSGAAPFVYAGVRCALGAGAMALLGLASREALPRSRHLLVTLLVGGALTMGGYFAFLYVGEQAVPGGLASILVATNPLWSAMFALQLLPRERLGRWGFAGLLAGFVGVLVIFLPEVGSPGPVGPLPLLEVLAAPALFALGTVLFRRLLPEGQAFWGISSQLTGGAAVLLVGACLLPGGAALPWTLPVGVSLLYLVLVPTSVGYVVYFRLHHRIGPTQANLVSFVSPVSGLLLGLALLSEVPTVLSLVGLALVASGLFLVGRGRRPVEKGPGRPEAAVRRPRDDA